MAARSTRSTLIETLEPLAAPFGIGRGIHLGDTIIGTKGRVAFEAPAAEVLLTAHRELEKLVLTARQQRIKELVAQPYGDLVHEGQLLDPVCRDIEALLLSSQARVSGDVHLLMRTGQPVHRGRRVAVLAAWPPPAASMARRPGNGPPPMRSASRKHRRAARACSIAAPASAPTQASPSEVDMRTVVVDKIASVTQACGLLARGARLRRHPRRGRRGDGGRGAQQQVDLQHPRAHERPHGQGRQGRHRGRAPSVTARRCSATRVMCPSAVQARRRHPDAQHRRRARACATR